MMGWIEGNDAGFRFNIPPLNAEDLAGVKDKAMSINCSVSNRDGGSAPRALY